MRTLKHGSIGIIVEGIAGIYDGATIDQERVFLEQRKGFIKCAIQAGVGATHETALCASSLGCLACRLLVLHALTDPPSCVWLRCACLGGGNPRDVLA